MRLVILLLDVQRRETIEVETSKKVEEMKTTKIKRKKVRSLATLLKMKINMDLTIMRMKWWMLQ